MNRFVTAAALMVATAGSVSAAEVMPRPVVQATASVIGVCESYREGTIAFNVDPSSGAPTGASFIIKPQVKCTNQTPFTVAAASANQHGGAASCAAPGITGTLRSRENAADAFDYTFTCGTAGGVGAGFGAGREQDIDVAGLVSPAQYSRAVPHADYQDTITLDLKY